MASGPGVGHAVGVRHQQAEGGHAGVVGRYLRRQGRRSPPSLWKLARRSQSGQVVLVVGCRATGTHLVGAQYCGEVRRFASAAEGDDRGRDLIIDQDLVGRRYLLGRRRRLERVPGPRRTGETLVQPVALSCAARPRPPLFVGDAVRLEHRPVRVLQPRSQPRPHRLRVLQVDGCAPTGCSTTGGKPSEGTAAPDQPPMPLAEASTRCATGRPSWCSPWRGC